MNCVNSVITQHDTGIRVYIMDHGGPHGIFRRRRGSEGVWIAMCAAGQLADEQTAKMLKRNTKRYSSVLRWREIVARVTTWMNLKGSICHTQEHKYFIILGT